MKKKNVDHSNLQSHNLGKCINKFYLSKNLNIDSDYRTKNLKFNLHFNSNSIIFGMNYKDENDITICHWEMQMDLTFKNHIMIKQGVKLYFKT